MNSRLALRPRWWLFAVSGAWSCALSCNAVLGLDDREHATSAVDTGPIADTLVFDSGSTRKPDAEAPTDSALVDTGVDAHTSIVCTGLGLKCASDQSCIVSYSLDRTYAYACEPAPFKGKLGEPCVYDGKTYKCQEGLACNDAYPSGKVCVSLCLKDGDCLGGPAGYSWCGGMNWISKPPFGTISRCNSCDPVPLTNYAPPCTDAGAERCGVTSQASAPSCLQAGSRSQGQTCYSPTTECGGGYVCDCTTELGSPACDGKSGVCQRLCRTPSDCTVVGFTKCLPARSGSTLSTCAP